MTYAQSGPHNHTKVHFDETGSGLAIQLIEQVSGYSQLEAHGDVNFLPEGVILDWTDNGTSGTRSFIPYSNIKAINQTV